MVHDLTTQKGRNTYMEAMEKSSVKRETYNILVEVRDENYKMIKGLSVNKQKIVNKPELQFDFSDVTIEQLELRMKQVASTLRAWLPSGYKINIGASVLNTISQTYMTMYSYYESEDRFVKH